MKKVLFFGFAGLLCLASCSDDAFVGDQSALGQSGNDGAILFQSTKGGTTRATQSGVEAANALGRQFYVYGAKSNGELTPTYQVVFNQYSVWYDGNKSTSNSDGWEYVGSTASFTDQTGITRQHTLPAVTNQTIKYWDYAAPNYWFNAVSVANASSNENQTFVPAATEAPTANTTAHVGQISYVDVTNVNEDNTVFYADAVKREKANYANTLANGQTNTDQPVHFLFKRLQAKVRIGFYETVPGYAINEVKFYPAASTLVDSKAVDFGTPSAANVTIVTNAIANATPALEAGFMPASGQKYTITYDYGNNGLASLKNTTTSLEYQKSKTFGSLNYTVARDLVTPSGNEYYMGESASSPTWASATAPNNITVPAASPYTGSAGNNYWMVLPNESQSASFKIKVDYTLTSLDGSKETIHVTGAEAVVPAEYCHWMGNKAYTYLFKISDNTNGTTGTPGDDPAGLYPITFDACVEDVMDNTQETITTVATPSITTYAEGSAVTTNDEYTASETIVLKVENAPAGYTFNAWHWNNHEGAITEQEAAFLDATTSMSWTSISDNKFTATGAAGHYAIVRLTYAEEFTPASGVDVSTDDYTNSTLATPVPASTQGNGSTKYYHKKYAYKVIKIKA